MNTVGTLIQELRHLPNDAEVLIGIGESVVTAYEIERIYCSIVPSGIDGEPERTVHLMARK